MTDRTFSIPKRIVAYILLYNFFLWLTFAVVYRRIDFETHFDVPQDFDHGWSWTAYYAFQISTQMYGTTIVPKTTTGRTLVAIHGLFAWAQTVVFLAPWIAITSYSK
jgi:serine acetyltransferase